MYYSTLLGGWGAKELCGDPTVGPLPKVWNRGQIYMKWRRKGSDVELSRRKRVRLCR